MLNCRGICSKVGDIKLMVYTKKPHIISLSETWLTKYMPKFVGYEFEWWNSEGFAGGLGFLIKKGVMYQNITLMAYRNDFLEYQPIVVKMDSGPDLKILHIYNPNKSVGLNKFIFYIDQLGTNFILCGDFNAHSKMLYAKCKRPSVTGGNLERLVGYSNICLINPCIFYIC